MSMLPARHLERRTTSGNCSSMWPERFMPRSASIRNSSSNPAIKAAHGSASSGSTPPSTDAGSAMTANQNSKRLDGTGIELTRHGDLLQHRPNHFVDGKSFDLKFRAQD